MPPSWFYTGAMTSIAASHTVRGRMFSRWVRFLARRYGTNEAGTDVFALTSSDSEQIALNEIAANNKWRLRLTRDPRHAIEQLREHASGVILCDRDLVGVDWRKQMGDLRRSAPRSCVILLSGVNDQYLWDEVIRNGGYDVLSKPLQETQVVLAVTGAWLYWKHYRTMK